MNINDFVPGFDPTGSVTITAAQLAQLVASATPSSDRGLVIVTTDSSGVPVLPDTTDYPRIENYLWLRLSPLTSSFIVAAWNPSQVYNMGYSNGSGLTVSTNWNPVSTGSIPAGSIQGYQIAAGTITADKLAGGITTSQLASGATFLTTSSTPTLGDITAASTFGGGLIIAPLAVTTGKIAVGGVTTPNIAAGAATLTTLDTTGTAGQVLWNSSNGVPAWGTFKIITGLTNPNVGGGNDGQVIAVLSGAAGTFQYYGGVSVGNAFTGDTSTLATTGNLASAGVANPAFNATGMTHYVALDTPYTPKNNLNLLYIEAFVQVGVTTVTGNVTANTNIWVYLFGGTAGQTLLAAAKTTVGFITNVLIGTGGSTVCLRAQIANPGTVALSFNVRFGVNLSAASATVASVNPLGESSSIKITEVLR